MNYSPQLFIAQTNMINALNRIQGIIKFDINGNILEANDLFCRIMGYEANEIIGRHHGIFCNSDYVVTAEYLNFWDKLRSGAILDGQFNRFDKNMKSVWLQASYNPVWDMCGNIDHIVKFATDITEKKHSEIQLFITKRYLEFSNKTAVIGDWKFDVYAKEFVFSEFLTSLLGFEENVNKVEFDIFLKRIHVDFRQLLIKSFEDSIKFEKNWDFEFIFIDSNKKEKWFRCTGGVDAGAGTSKVLIGLMQDISYIKQRENQLLQAQNTAEEAVKTKDKFLASMSHELRTPLNAILGFARLLSLSNNLTNYAKDQIFEIISASKHMLVLVNDLLDLAEVNHGSAKIKMEMVSVNKVVNECVGLLRDRSYSNGISLAVNISTDITVWADAFRLKQVLINLISNAIKYNRPDGSVEITADLHDDRQFKIVVSDTGLGIDDIDISNLFMPFSRVGANTAEIQGTGIGLSITKDLVQKMGGTIGVESIKSVGSKFWITLLKPNSDLIEENDKLITSKSGIENFDAEINELKDYIVANDKNRDFSDKKILVVDDNPTNRKLIGQQIKFLGCQYDFAEDGEKALDLYKENLYDLVLTDLQMPRMDGYQLTSNIRFYEKNYNKNIPTPIVVLSANAYDAVRMDLTQLGVDDFLTKPIDISILIEKLKYWLGYNSSINDVNVNNSSGWKKNSEILNIDVLLGYIGNQKELIFEFLEEFKLSAVDLVDGFEKSHTNQDWTVLARLAHMLKSSARTVGAISIGELSSDIEISALNSESQKLNTLMVNFRSEWNLLIDALNKELCL